GEAEAAERLVERLEQMLQEEEEQEEAVRKQAEARQQQQQEQQGGQQQQQQVAGLPSDWNEGGLGGSWHVSGAEVAERAEVLQELIEEVERRQREGEAAPEMQQKLYSLLEAGDTAGLEALVGREAVHWISEQLQEAVQEQQEEEQQQGAAGEQQKQQEEEEDAEFDPELDAPELALGWRLKPSFMRRFAAVLEERTEGLAALAARG
ncbi:hypothetical protein Agub_g4675, partial [Astrephomene gubernaculifera]